MSATENKAARLIDTSTEPHITIDSNRNITVPPQLRQIAVQYDHNIETVMFDCPRFWDDHDLSEMRIFINYMRADKEVGQFECTETVEVDPDDRNIMHFSWTVTNHVTEVNGTISFLVCIKATDAEGVLRNRWSSLLNQHMSVKEGLDVIKEYIDMHPDVINSITQRLTALETSNNKMSERIATLETSNTNIKERVTKLEKGTITTDTTLTKSGAAADAKTVGDMIGDITTLLDAVNGEVI